MLPAGRTHRFGLADVFPNCVAALRGEPGRLGLRPVRHAVVVVVDGLGAAALEARRGHARAIMAASSPGEIGSVVPTTTAAGLTTLLTAAAPGRHGLVGYLGFDPANERIVNLLTGWGDDLDPATWQRMPTVFETTPEVPGFAIGPAKFAGSGFTAAILRGADYRGRDRIADRFAEALAVRAATDRSLSYLYVPELDIASHHHGGESQRWIEALEELDAAIGEVAAELPADTGMLLTSDHGALDIPVEAHVILGAAHLDGVRRIGGEPRFVHLYVESGAGDVVAARWRELEGGRSWIATREEAIAAGWFGEVDDEVGPRIGDVLVAARRPIAYYPDALDRGRSMIGQHGSLTPAERAVPLRRFGAFRAG